MSDAISRESNGLWECYEDEDGEDFDYDDEWPFDCGMMRDGTCSKAGSEECEFECPFNE